MGIFTDNPVLGRELRSRLRLRKFPTNRPLAVVMALALLVIVWFYVKALVGIASLRADDALALWSYLILFLLLLIVIITPALLSTAITQEREQQTWEALATTRLSGAQVLLGKWLGRSSLAALPVVVLLPFLISSAARGTLRPTTFLASLFFLGMTTAGYGMLGMLCSFLSRKSVSATVTALTITLILCVGTPIVASLMPNIMRAASSDDSYHDPMVLWLNPFYALPALVTTLEARDVGVLSSPNSGAGATVPLCYLALTALTAAAAFYYMTSRYRHAAQKQ